MVVIGLPCGPGCLACESCEIVSDDFDRSNSTNIATGSTAGWVEEFGDFSIASNKLVTSSAFGKAYCTAATAGAAPAKVQVTVKGATNNDQIRVYIKYTDGNDNLFAELTIGSSKTLKLWKTVGGTTTQLATKAISTTAGSTYNLTVCYANNVFAAYESVTNTRVGYATSTTITTQQSAALGAGATITTATFDDFTFSYGYDPTSFPSCDHCKGADCGACVSAGGDTPQQLQVTLAGVTSGVGGFCSDCNLLDGVYILTLDPNSACSSDLGCIYCLDMPQDLTCSITETPLQMTICISPWSGSYNIRMNIRRAATPGSCVESGSGFLDWSVIGVTTHCDLLSGVDLPSRSAGVTAACGVPVTGTCTVDAL